MASGEQPSSASQDSSSDSSRRYQPNLQGMLQYCAEHTQPSESGASTAASTAQQMDSERRAWLENVINDVDALDPVKHLQKLITVLTAVDVTQESPPEDQIATLEGVLETIVDLCEDIDLATCFEQCGGYDLLPRYLHCTWSSGIRAWTAECIAALVQNNPHCQEKALQANLLQLLLNVVDTDACPTVRTKALSAVSCLSRDYKAGQEQFVELDGFSVLLRAMQCEVSKLQQKAAFMLNTMIQHRPDYKDKLVELGIVSQLIRLLHQQHDSSHEHLMSALLTMARDHAGVAAECTREKLGLSQLLHTRSHILHGKAEYQEEYEYCNELLKILNFTTPGSKADT